VDSPTHDPLIPDKSCVTDYLNSENIWYNTLLPCCMSYIDSPSTFFSLLANIVIQFRVAYEHLVGNRRLTQRKRRITETTEQKQLPTYPILTTTLSKLKSRMPKKLSPHHLPLKRRVLLEGLHLPVDLFLLPNLAMTSYPVKTASGTLQRTGSKNTKKFV